MREISLKYTTRNLNYYFVSKILYEGRIMIRYKSKIVAIYIYIYIYIHIYKLLPPGDNPIAVNKYYYYYYVIFFLK